MAAVNGVQAWMQGGANWGSKWKAFVKETRIAEWRLPSENDVAVEDNYLIRPNRERSAGISSDSNHRRIQRK